MQSQDNGNFSSNNLLPTERGRAIKNLGDNLSSRYMQRDSNFMSQDSLSADRLATVAPGNTVKMSFRKSPFYQKQRTKAGRPNAARLSILHMPSVGSRNSSFLP